LIEAVLGQKILGCEADDCVRDVLLPDDPGPGGLFFRRAKLQMNEWVGPSLPVEIGTSRRFETELAIKAHGLRILFVDIGGQRRMRCERRLHERASDPFAMMARIDEKRLHMPFMQKHEANRLIRRIDRECQRDLRKKSLNFVLDCDAIFGAKETMGGVNGLAPYLKDAARVASVGSAKCNHGFPLAITGFSRHGGDSDLSQKVFFHLLNYPSKPGDLAAHIPFDF